jgi:hypothetical protein
MPTLLLAARSSSNPSSSHINGGSGNGNGNGNEVFSFAPSDRQTEAPTPLAVLESVSMVRDAAARVSVSDRFCQSPKLSQLRCIIGLLFCSSWSRHKS